MMRKSQTVLMMLVFVGSLSVSVYAADQDASEIELFNGESLGQWTATDFYGQGTVTVEDGAIVMARGNDMTGITWTGPVIRQNYEISLEAKRVEGMDFFCGLTFPVGDEYCSFICGGWGGSVVGISSVDYFDASSNVTSSSFDFENDRWYRIRVRVTEDMLQAWIDEDLKVDLNTKEHNYSIRFEVEKSRPLGIATWQTSGAVRNIRMRKVESFPRFQPTYAYSLHEIEGWRVFVSPLLDANYPSLTQDTLRLLTDQLYRINRCVPASALKKLHNVKIWVEFEDRNHACMCYHPDKEWLITHGYNPDKKGSVDIANAGNFLKWTHDQPWMVLHELAHAFHHQVLGYDQPDIKKAFDSATRSGIYQNVLRINGKTGPHYAMNNDQEYFAECSEAYFGTNDFYPFVRAELQQHDPNMFALMEKLWNTSE
jgi:hypothetical protein